MKEQMYVLKESEVRLKLSEGRQLYSPIPMTSPDAATDVMCSLLKEYDREVACVVNLDGKLRPINFSIVGMGGQNVCPVAISNVFKSALLSGASSILFLHNHPSGDVNPSREDIALTEKLILAGAVLDVPVNDHIIIGGYNGDYYSIRYEHPEIDFSMTPHALKEPEPERPRRRGR